MKLGFEIQRVLLGLLNKAAVDGGAYGHLIQHFTTRHRLPLHALQLHARIVVFSVTPDNFLASKLINFYTRENRFRQALHVFDEITVKNAFSYNALLIAYTSREMYFDAFSLFLSWIGSSSGAARPDSVSVSCVLKALSGYDGFLLGSLARQVHGFVIRGGFDSDVFVGNGMITYYTKCDNIESARKVFDEMSERDVVSWNSMISGYSQSGSFENCKELYKRMLRCPDLKPNGVTVISVLQACGQSSDLVFGMEVHKKMIENHIQMDLSLCNAVIGFYAKCGSLDYARALFDEMSEKDSVTHGAIISGYMAHGLVNEAMDLFGDMENIGLSTWNAVISGLMQNNHHEEVISSFREMIRGGSRPNTVTLSSLLPSLTYSSNLKGGKEIHAFAIRYMAHGLVNEAMDLFGDMENIGLSTWNAVISGLMQNNHHEEVISSFREMIRGGSRPNTVTLSSLLPSLTYSSNLKGGKEIHAFAIRNGADSNIYVTTSIVDNYAKLGFLPGAQRVFDNCKDRSLIVWTAIITAYAVHGDSDSACRLFEQMQCLGTKPDNVTLTAVLSAFAHSGDSDKAQDIFDSMVTKYDIEPGVEHYACMVSVLSRAGKLSDAIEFIARMPIEPIAKVWGALLNGASVLGDVEIARFACDRLFEMEPENTGNYTIMANLYTQAGRWEEAEIVRDKMTRIGLKKIPGTSWIETDKGLRSFIAKDSSCERSKEMYNVIEGLIESMSDKEYIMKQELDVTY
ncbi:PREDICTED: pentatricopeptide repeat-containing protein At2g37310-like [Camelina sativa]|uniref:Pentatricopeptide repeat-containing protein At2g37310-like n=1 Tax=Camelina sativa TaxID=90675 RepID=A0ABM1RP21_CAMSA|nr:PREDICTED: pentatricopeptide repeat-containing protein At2g37310-like [Camelina sativa]